MGPPAPTATKPALPVWKRLLFGAIIATVSVTLFFGALEAGLRLAGYGYDPRFYRPIRDAEGVRWMRDNRDFGLTYFPPALVRRPQAFRIAAEKPPETYRIFVLGSSAAMGDPEASFSIARTLEAMLRAAYPTRRFEVINAAMTAVNSHVARAIAADCARLQPDLFIVYEGHNEVIGPFGPAAVLAPFLRSPQAVGASVLLKRSRTGQCLGDLAGAIGIGADRDLPADWGGMGMFLEHEIAASDPRLAAVRATFAANLEAIVDAAGDVEARVLLCTVLTNQRDFAPFLSRHRADLTPEELQQWEDAYAAGNHALAEGDNGAAEAHYQLAGKIDDQHADLAFRLGRACLAQGREAEAREFLQRALDLDALRFRTDSKLNETIRAVAAARSEDAELVDLAALMAAKAPHGVIGDEMLYEHVHLTFRGTWEIARLLFARVGQDLVRRGDVSTAAAEPFTYDEARLRLGYTTYEQAMIMRELLRRFSAPPFTNQADHGVRIATWQRRAAAADQLLARPNSRAALTALYDQALAFAPDDWVLLRNRGMALVALGAPGLGLPSLEKARAIIDDDPDLLFALATALRAIQRDSDAAQVLEALRQLEPGYPGLPGNP